MLYLIGLIIIEIVGAADLQCYMGRNPRGHQPYLFDVCHRYRFSQPPQCLKFTQGEITTRDCDPSFLCERFNIRNRCVKGVKQAHLYGEICCCSSDLCNSALYSGPLISFSIFIIISTLFIRM